MLAQGFTAMVAWNVLVVPAIPTLPALPIGPFIALFAIVSLTTFKGRAKLNTEEAIAAAGSALVSCAAMAAILWLLSLVV